MAAAGDAVFAVGSLGTVLEWDGSRFRRHAAFTRDELRSVWLSSPDDVWVASIASEVFHYDGSHWSKLDAKGLKVSGAAPDDVWIDTQRYDGTTLRELKPAEIAWPLDLLAIAPDDVWLVGLLDAGGGSIAQDKAAVMHFDGSRWTRRGDLGDAPVWNAQLVPVGDEIWVHDGWHAHRLVGERWEQVPGEFGYASWSASAESGRPSEARLFDGANVVSVPAALGCAGALRVSEAETFCWSGDGRLFRFDGHGWLTAPADEYGPTLAPEQWGRVPPAMWAGEAKLAWGSGPSDVLRVRPGEPGSEPADVLERYDGERWSELARGNFWDISGSARDNVWIAGQPILHWDGHAVREVPLPADQPGLVPSAVVSFGAHATFFIGRTYDTPSPVSRVYRYDGAWSSIFEQPAVGQPQYSFDDITGRSEDDVWLVATQRMFLRERGLALLFHFDGATWHTSQLALTWGMTGLELDGETLWLKDGEGVYRLQLQELQELGRCREAITPTNTFDHAVLGVAMPLNDSQIWRGASDLWLTTTHRVMRLPL